MPPNPLICVRKKERFCAYIFSLYLIWLYLLELEELQDWIRMGVNEDFKKIRNELQGIQIGFVLISWLNPPTWKLEWISWSHVECKARQEESSKRQKNQKNTFVNFTWIFSPLRLFKYDFYIHALAQHMCLFQ